MSLFAVLVECARVCPLSCRPFIMSESGGLWESGYLPPASFNTPFQPSYDILMRCLPPSGGLTPPRAHFLCFQDEVLTLDAAYGAGYRPITVDDAARTVAMQYTARFKRDIHKLELFEGILSRTRLYGATEFVSRDSTLGGECEREMELELEEEEEVERQVAKMRPRKEIDWDYSAALSMHSLTEVSKIAKVRIRLLSQLSPKLSFPTCWNEALGCGCHPPVPCALAVFSDPSGDAILPKTDRTIFAFGWTLTPLKSCGIEIRNN